MAVLVLIGAVSVLPLATVEAPIEKPSLDWWEEGHTF